MGIFSLFKKPDLQKIRINVPKRESNIKPKDEKRNVSYQAEHTQLRTKRRIMTKGVPGDYFFGGSEKIKCKQMNILDPLAVDVYKAYFNGIPGREEWHQASCFAIAETDDYIFYNYGCFPDGSSGCNLRQNKDNPKKVVFFGKSRMLSCIFHDHLVQVDWSAYGTELYLWTRDVHNGKERIYPWFGKYAIPTGTGSRYDQDSVLDMRVDKEKDAIIIDVRRTFCDFADSEDSEYICNADTVYTLVVTYKNGQFFAKAEFPELNVTQVFENI
ncbi:MAG: hypothetical protein IIU86_04650 [Oscillospiraceae bacterium]|nr:hypothetical protein [Oscillospiraceae bacterium]